MRGSGALSDLVPVVDGDPDPEDDMNPIAGGCERLEGRYRFGMAGAGGNADDNRSS